MYSESTVKKYLQLVEKIEDKRKELYSVVELCEILNISRPTLTAFLKGDIVRFDLLEQVGELLGYKFSFDLKMEVWADIPNYEGYQVSNLGRVKSLKYGKERILKIGTNNHGYYYVVLYIKNSTKNKTVHQLVAMAFLNHTPNGHTLVVDHINNDKTDNTLGNLQIITSRENTSKDRKGISKHTGVNWSKERKKWRTQIKINGKYKHLGYFNCEEDAAYAYLLKLREINN
jgi:hypothetical protein